MPITAEAVKTLREKTGAGMMECKRALVETEGDCERAVEWLRKRGLAAAAKKASRTAAEGLIGHCVAPGERAVVLVEVNCETDFVAKNPDFQQFVAAVAAFIGMHAPADLPALLASRLGAETVAEAQTGLVARIGEKIGIRRFVIERAPAAGSLGWYLHAGSKIGVVVGFDDPAGRLPAPARREVAMHVAAMHPRYVRRSDVPAAVVAKEEEIQRAQLEGEKKPPAVLDKIVTGRLNKFYAEACLDEQVFVKDPEGKRTVAQVVQAYDPAIRIAGMVRFQVGEAVAGSG